ncbi:MAG: Tol-Pal system protein TolB [Alphaproteobacteria bacterium]|nr:Tol-Pal system protein TolB [Alphaproteobacteria bacterium]
MKKLFIVLVIFFVTTVHAELRINIDGAKSDPTPIAIADFATSSSTNLGVEIPRIIRDDLERSNLFRIIDPDAYIQTMDSLATQPKFADWQAIGAHALIHGEITESLDGKIRVAFRLWDIYANQQLDAKTLATSPESWRKIAHIIADTIYERLTGEKGYFDSKIAFISETGNANKRKRRLAVMDQDGANLRYLTDGKSMAMTPRFSPNMKEIVYMSYEGGKPQVHLLDTQTLKSRTLYGFEGMSFAPRFSPDGKKLVFSMSKRGNSDIYSYDLETNKRTQLTTHLAIDTSPSFSPDGKRIVFNSDRSGRQQLYVMKADGSDVKRISFGEGSYATPVWSPRSDYIAFTKIKDGMFYIGLMRPDGSSERLIANGWLVEGPTWSPNGRLIAFWKQSPMDKNGRGQTAKIHTIDITGYYEQELQTSEDASDPAWSPLLH